MRLPKETFIFFITYSYYKPPRIIFDLLHEAEGKGIKIPYLVDKWWEKETFEQERLRTKTEQKDG